MVDYLSVTISPKDIQKVEKDTIEFLINNTTHYYGKFPLAQFIFPFLIFLVIIHYYGCSPSMIDSEKREIIG